MQVRGYWAWNAREWDGKGTQATRAGGLTQVVPAPKPQLSPRGTGHASVASQGRTAEARGGTGTKFSSIRRKPRARGRANSPHSQADQQGSVSSDSAKTSSGLSLARGPEKPCQEWDEISPSFPFSPIGKLWPSLS